MSLPGPVTYQISEGDYHAFARLVFRRRWPWSFAGPLALGASVSAVLWWTDWPLWKVFVPVVAGLGAAMLTVGVGYLMLGSRSTAIFRETAALHEPCMLVFGADNFCIERASGVSRTRWRDLVQWGEDEDILAAYPNRLMAIIFPKAQLSEDVVDFMREQMKQSGLPSPWKLRK